MKLFSGLGAVLVGCLFGGVALAQLGATVVTLKDAAGAPVRALVAGAEDAPAGILLVHDYFGFSPFYIQAAEHLAAQGYRVVAIDLYKGRSTTDGQEAGKLMGELQAQDRAVTDRALQAGMAALQRSGRRIGTLGFSAGGLDALNATLAQPQAVQATAIIYGFGFGQLAAERVASVQGPILTVTGALDEGSLQASLDLMARRSALAAPLEMHVLPNMRHAYAQPLFDGGKGYSAPDTAQTWQTIDRFFARYLLERVSP